MAILITDKLNNPVNLSSSPKRIVSLVPSQTELLYNLGLDKEVVGITKFCVHPKEWFRSKRHVGGTKTVKPDVVKTLLPDLIIANKEENVKKQIDELQQIAPVWVSDISTLEDAIDMITSIGKLVDAQARANKLANQIQEAFGQIKPVNEKILTAYLIWKDPYMAAGGDTFIHDMISRCGLTNIFQDINRYPEVTTGKSSTDNNHKSIINPLSSLINCQLLLLSSEPYPFKKQHLDELQMLLPSTKIILVDGEMFSWYGSRLLYSAQYFKNLIQKIQQ